MRTASSGARRGSSPGSIRRRSPSSTTARRSAATPDRACSRSPATRWRDSITPASAWTRRRGSAAPTWPWTWRGSARIPRPGCCGPGRSDGGDAMSPTDLATEPPQAALTTEQLDDLAKLLAQTVVRGNLARLATVLMGPAALQEAGNEIGDVTAFARRIVETLNAAGRIPDAVGLLRQEAHRNSRLTAGLNYILRGGRFGDDAAAQKFVNEYEPLLSSATFQERFPRVSRTVCAIGLGAPLDSIVGSGFLIAPDLVMTNYHVIEPFLEVLPDGTIGPRESGEKIFFFFDYLWEPAPKAPFGAVKHAGLAVQAAEKDWLVYARGRLPFDGTLQCAARSVQDVDNRYDYAVIRLARPVGSLPVRPSGGPDRGWLLLPGEELDLLGGQKRVIVFQHPGKAPQQFDIGEYVRMDLSGTRVWYSVSTAKGSSDGAAVDTEGS